MRLRRSASLYWRFLPSYLLVVLVAAVTTFVAGEVVGTYFIDRHVDEMVRSLHSHTGEPIDAMAADLESSYRQALTQSLLWAVAAAARSEERRVGKEGRGRWRRDQSRRKT